MKTNIIVSFHTCSWSHFKSDTKNWQGNRRCYTREK